MIKYIIPLLLIYFIYIYSNPIFLKDHGNHIKYLIEKNIIILFVSVLSLTIIWRQQIKSDETIIFTMMIILINLALWIRIIKYQSYDNQAINMSLLSQQITESTKREPFISSISKPRDYSYTSKEAQAEFEADFLNECYDHKLLIPGFKPLVPPEQAEAEAELIRETTLDLALNSDNMFSVQQKENKCIIANYIPNDLQLISNNTICNNIVS